VEAGGGYVFLTGDVLTSSAKATKRQNARQNAKTPKRQGNFMRNHTRATIYFSADIFKALRMKAAATHRSMSEMVNEAVKEALAEDAIDLDALALLRDDADTTFNSFVSGLRRRGTL
jgi:plasmid stability protein